MKVIYTIAGMYRPAGMERILADKAGYLARNGYDVLIVTTEQKGRPDVFPLERGIRRTDIAVGYEDNNGGSFLSKVIRYPFKKAAHRRRLTALLMEERPDIVVSMFCGDETFLPGIKDGSRKVLEVHFSRFKRLQYGRRGLWGVADRWRSRREEKTVSGFDRFVTLTQEDYEYWNSPVNGRVIPNFLSVTPLRSSSLEIHTVIAVGRLTYQKGFDRLLRVWASVVRMLPADNDWVLRIVGDGEDAGNLKAYVGEAGLEGRVVFSPVEMDMDAVYRDSSLLVMASRYEGLPMVLLEAQSYGLPIVSYDCKCGPKDVVCDGEDGFLIPDGDGQSMARAIVRLIMDKEERDRMGRAALIRSERWRKEPIMKKWMELFEEL